MSALSPLKPPCVNPAFTSRLSHAAHACSETSVPRLKWQHIWHKSSSAHWAVASGKTKQRRSGPPTNARPQNRTPNQSAQATHPSQAHRPCSTPCRPHAHTLRRQSSKATPENQTSPSEPPCANQPTHPASNRKTPQRCFPQAASECLHSHPAPRTKKNTHAPPWENPPPAPPRKNRTRNTPTHKSTTLHDAPPNTHTAHDG